MSDIHLVRMVDHNHSLLTSGEYSDMTVRCGSEEFKIHRAIVCPRSKFFAAICNGQYKESATGVTELKEDDPPTVLRMLTYLYTFDYDDEEEAASIAPYMLEPAEIKAPSPNVPLSDRQALIHTRLLNNVAVYAIAEKYDIPELKELAQVKFESSLGDQEPHSNLPIIVNAVWETTPSSDRGMRDVVFEYCKCFDQEIISNEHLSGMLQDHGDLAVAVMREMLEERAQNESSSKATIKDLRQRLVRAKECLGNISTKVKDENGWVIEVDAMGENNPFSNLSSTLLKVHEEIDKVKESITVD